MLADFRHAFRSLARARSFTVVSLLIIALCLGANLTIFAVVDAVLLRSLPFPQPNQLVTIYNTYPKAGVGNDGASVTNYYERRGQIAAFSSLSVFRPDNVIVGPAGSAEQIDALRVSPDFFDTLGIGPVIGRSFREEETTYQTDGVVILTDAYWRRHFAADPQIVGRTMRLNGHEREIVGVLPPRFRFLSSPAQLFVPYASDPANRGPNNRHSGSSTSMVARLKPGATLEQAQSQIDAHNALVAPTSPSAKMIAEAGFRSVVVSLHGDHVRSVQPILLLLQAGVLLLLLIGTVNLINLLLIRASSRMREFAIRQSMGAGWMHVIREVLAETMLLALGGGALGLIVASFGIDLVRLLGADRLPLGSQVVFDDRVAGAALIATLLFGVVIAVPIAWFNLRTHLANALQSSSRGSTMSRAGQRLRHAFIITQIALAFVLLSGAGMLAISFQKVMHVSPGFRPDHILSGSLSLPWNSYAESSARVAFVEKLTAELESRPGIIAAGLTTRLPLSGNSGKSAVTVKGHVMRPGETLRAHYTYGVGGDYFSAMGIPLKSGRFLSATDSRRPDKSCVVDEDLAKRYWPNGDALGQQLFPGSRPGPNDQPFTVVGIVGSVKQAELTETDALGAVYFPFAHQFELETSIVVRAQQAPESLANIVKSAVQGIDPELVLSNAASMDALIANGLVARRSPTLLAGIFAAVALLLAAVGSYGVLSYAVAQREREIGVRMALGAQAAQIGRQFLGMGFRLLAIGATLGLLGAWLCGRAMQAVLFDVPAVHLGILVVTLSTLSAVSLFACYLPARRASRVDPMVALRSE